MGREDGTVAISDWKIAVGVGFTIAMFHWLIVNPKKNDDGTYEGPFETKCPTKLSAEISSTIATGLTTGGIVGFYIVLANM